MCDVRCWWSPVNTFIHKSSTVWFICTISWNGKVSSSHGCAHTIISIRFRRCATRQETIFDKMHTFTCGPLIHLLPLWDFTIEYSKSYSFPKQLSCQTRGPYYCHLKSNLQFIISILEHPALIHHINYWRLMQIIVISGALLFQSCGYIRLWAYISDSIQWILYTQDERFFAQRKKISFSQKQNPNQQVQEPKTLVLNHSPNDSHRI